MLSQAILAAAPAPAAEATSVTLDATGVYYRDLNAQLLELAQSGVKEITLKGIFGQRYIGTNLQKQVRIIIDGVPGNDLGAFMDGPRIDVLSNAQDGCGNTMNNGTIIIRGSAGDILGHSMRGGKIFVRGNVGYRVGIHMKEYGSVRPVIVIGGAAQHFLGEYMAGGVLIVLGMQLAPGESHPSHYVGTGMHGGVIYMRGQVDQAFLGKEVGQAPLGPEDEWLLQRHVGEFAAHFDLDAKRLLETPFVKLIPLTKRPYGRLYAY